MLASRIPVPLQRNQLLRILHGRGTRVTSQSGMLWLSEEGSLDDRVLLRGDSITLEHAGKSLVFAVHPSRVIVEIPDGVPPPRALEVARADGQPGRRIGLGALESAPGGRPGAVVVGFLLRSLDALCSKLLHQRSFRDTP